VPPDSDEQKWKHSAQSISTDVGIQIERSKMQLENADIPIVFIPNPRRGEMWTRQGRILENTLYREIWSMKQPKMTVGDNFETRGLEWLYHEHLSTFEPSLRPRTCSIMILKPNNKSIY
jgi:hypothetical protein